MTDLATNLTEWLAQYPEPEPVVSVRGPNDDAKASARFFGFDADSLTWASDDEAGVIALIDGVGVLFTLFHERDGYIASVRGDSHPYRYSPELLAFDIRCEQSAQANRRAQQEAEHARAAELEARPRVRQLQVEVGNLSDNKRLADLLNIHGWELKFAPFTWLNESENQLYQLYTLTRD